MRKFRIGSDIHTEFMKDHKLERMLERAFTVTEDDKNQTLVLAGDFGSMHKPKLLIDGLKILSARFKDIIYIPGNHEYYGGSLNFTEKAITSFLHDTNIFFGSQIVFSNRVCATTLWTDFDGGNPISMMLAKTNMNDYRLCKGFNGQLLTPEEVLMEHKRSLQFLKDNVKEGGIVITHHLPSFKSIDPEYTTSELNGAYATNLEEFILSAKPKLWIHGHTHVPHDYMIGDTRVVCNPRGYPGQEGNGYNPNLVIEL